MTLIDKVIPLYVWFAASFGMISMILGALNFGMLAVTLITVKGIYIPSWMIPAVVFLIIAYCIITGFLMEKYDIMNRILNHQNRKQNPQIKQISEDVAYIKKMLEKQ